jgi:hypothetical protein
MRELKINNNIISIRTSNKFRGKMKIRKKNRVDMDIINAKVGRF